MENKGLGTICVQGGWSPKKGEPRILPIYQSTTFKYDSCDDLAKLFNLEASGYFYSRLSNPTNDNVAAKIASLEGGVAAMLTSSGHSAALFALLNLCQAGDHIVSSSAIYGGVYNLLSTTLPKYGVTATFVDVDATPEQIQAAFTPRTKLLYGEVISNPGVSVLDIEKFAAVAHSNGVPLIIDNTLSTPINCRPFEWGADIVVHSTSKYMDGHATNLGGAIVDSGNFDWAAYGDKFAGLTQPDPSYHGVNYCETFGKGAYIVKATVQLMRDFGSCQSPHSSFLLNLGLETLHLRMPRHSENGQKVAEFLAAHPSVEWVSYPGLEGDKFYDLGQKYLANGASGVVAFGMKGGRERSLEVVDKLKMVAIVTHVADARSSAIHPASTTHRQLSDEQLVESGVRPELIRLSIGIEDIADIIADLEQALA